MNVRMLSFNTRNYEPLARITEPTREAFAKRWGHEYVFVQQEGAYSCWERPVMWYDHLEKAEWLFFSACDTMVTGLEHPLEGLGEFNYWKGQSLIGSSDLYVACDGNGLQSDVFLLRNCPSSFKWLEAVLEQEGKANNEQDAMSVALSRARNYGEFCDGLRMELRQGGASASPLLIERLRVALNNGVLRVCLVPQRRLNAYPLELYGGTGKEADSWQPGDFMMHLPGKSLEERLRVLPGYLKGDL